MKSLARTGGFRIAGWALLLLFATGAAAAREAAKDPETVRSGTAREIVDGDTLVLETGTQVRLVGIQARPSCRSAGAISAPGRWPTRLNGRFPA